MLDKAFVNMLSSFSLLTKSTIRLLRKETEMAKQMEERKMRFRNQMIAFLCLGLILWGGPVLGQDKEEQPPVTASSRFQLSGYTQLGYVYASPGTSTFLIRRARLSFSGEIIKHLRFRLQIDGIKNPVLVDAYIDVDFKRYLAFQVGQFYVPFGLESCYSDSLLDTILRAQVSDSLAPGRDIQSQGRDIGVQASGNYSIFEYYAGIFNGSGINKADTNKAKDYGLKLVLHPTKYLALGGSLYEGSYSAAQEDPAVARDRAGLHANLTVGQFSLTAEYISGKDGDIPKSGWYIKGLYNVIPKKLQGVARWDSYDPNTDIPSNRSGRLTLGGNWLFTDKTKLLINYQHDWIVGTGATSWSLLAQFQIGF
jgi:hypothetical protein